MPKPRFKNRSIFTGRSVRNSTTVKNNPNKQGALYARARSVGWGTTATKLERAADIAKARKLEIQANQAKGIREHLTYGQPTILQASVQRGYYRAKSAIAKGLGKFSRRREEKNAALSRERVALLQEAQQLRAQAAGRKTFQERIGSNRVPAKPVVKKAPLRKKSRVSISPRALKLNQQIARRAVEIANRRKETKKIIVPEYRPPRETVKSRDLPRFTPERANQLAEQLIREYEKSKKQLDLNPSLFPKEQLELMKELLNSGLLEKVEREYLQRLISRFSR